MEGEPRVVAACVAFLMSACSTGEAVEPAPAPPVEVTSLATSEAPPPGRAVEIGVADGRILREVEVGPDPLLAVGTSDAVWTLNLDDSSVSRIDAGTGEVTAPAIGEAVGIASDSADVWVATDGNRLVRLDGTTGAVVVELTLTDRELFGPRNAGWVVVAAGSVWVTVPPAGGGGHELWRVDPSEGTVLSRIPIGGDPFPPVVASGAIWIADSERELIVRVDMATEEVITIDVGPQPGAMTGGSGRVWASVPGEIVELDPGTGRELARIEVAAAPRGLAWADGRVWATTDVGVLAIDVERGRVVHEVDLAEPSDDEGPIALVPQDGSVWVTIETS